LIEEHAEQLGLDEATLEAIGKIVDEARAEGRELRGELRSAHGEMRALLSQDEPDEAAVMKQAETIGELETELQKHRLRSVLQIRALLTPEQREELVRIRQEFRARPMREVVQACQADVEKLCPDAELGRPRMQCLREHEEDLSDECQSAIESIKGRGGRGPHRGFRPAPPADF
jgi:Spy/CpxP family protein refolding chaperone